MTIVFCVLGAMAALAAPFGSPRGVSTRNLLKLERPAPHKLPKVHATAANPDTVFVVAFRVEFAEDSTTLTTGTGLFNSDTSYPNAYQFDKKPHDWSYFNKHLEYLKNYYYQVSGGKLVVQYSVYPNATEGAYKVSKEMRDYGVKKRDDENDCEFGLRHATSRMSFIEDAIRAAESDPAIGNPFHHSYDEKRTAYLLIHAGATGLSDIAGYDPFWQHGAPSPFDITDFFVSQADLQYFLHKDSIAVDDGRRSIKDLMMVSETGNQDSLNFGINGILVNQFAQQIGTPNLIGVNSSCIGMSTVGSFDIMDFAGYSAAMGFVPPYPSAWVRAFLGWDSPVLARPGKDSTYSIHAANSDDLSNRILQIPLNEHEYLLVENRQRNLPGRLDWFRRDTIRNTKEIYSGAPILDSIVIRDPSRSDLIVGSRNQEAGLPGSGVLVWHIDESVIRSLYKYNSVNADSARKGISLIEADGVRDIGSTFYDMIGNPIQDYGQPADFFPHRDAGGSNLVNSLSGIRTHDGSLAGVRIENIRPEQANPETLFSLGHSDKNDPSRRVVNFQSKTFSLDLRWSASLGDWPQYSDSLAAANDPAVLNLIDSIQGKEIIVASGTGRIFAWTQNGAGIGPLQDSVPARNARGDTLSWIKRRILFDLQDSLSSPAVSGDTAYMAGVRNLYRIYGGDSVLIDSAATGFRCTAGPVVAGTQILLGDAHGKIHALQDGAARVLDAQINNPVCALASADLDRNGKDDIVAALENGALVCFEEGEKKWSRNLDVSHPRIALGDLDRTVPARLEIVVRGREGKIFSLNASGEYDASFWPVSVKSNAPSQPALADLDGDKYLDIVLSGTDRVYALDRRGNALPNWPLVLSTRESIGDASAPSIADVDGNGRPDVVYGYGARDTVKNDLVYHSLGLIGAVDFKTKNIANNPWPLSSALPLRSSILLDHLESDSSLQTIAVSGRGWVYAWDLGPRTSSAAASFWNGGAGSLTRNPVYKEALMPSEPQPSEDPFAIRSFYCFPNPVKGKSSATLRYQLSHASDAAELTLYDQNNIRIKTITGLTATESWNRCALDLQGLGSAVYRAKLVVRRGSDKQAKFCKIAVIR